MHQRARKRAGVLRLAVVEFAKHRQHLREGEPITARAVRCVRVCARARAGVACSCEARPTYSSTSTRPGRISAGSSLRPNAPPLPKAQLKQSVRALADPERCGGTRKRCVLAVPAALGGARRTVIGFSVSFGLAFTDGPLQIVGRHEDDPTLRRRHAVQHVQDP